MAAPVALERAVPGGFAMPDGYQSLITFGKTGEGHDNIKFFEKSVQPPGIDGGDPIDTTTMHNSTWRTFAARSLKTLTDLTVTAAYDPAVLDTAELQAVANLETTVTVTFSDGSTIAFFGYLRSFEPTEMAEGEQPEGTLTVTPTNRDPESPFGEEGPVIVDVSGTP